MEQAWKDEEVVKKLELNDVVSNILQVKYTLQKLRLSIAFQDQEYSEMNGCVSGFVNHSVTHQSWSQFEEQFEMMEVKSNLESNHINESEVYYEKLEINDKIEEIMRPEVRVHLQNDALMNGYAVNSVNNSESNTTSLPYSSTCISETDIVVTSKFTTKYSVVVGNTSQYIPSVSANDQVTHKWMVYVRSLTDKIPLEHFTRCVIFFLHSTYAPNDIVMVTRPPFQLTKLGWGEFPVRVQLQFYGSFNKPVDIFHSLKLDQTHCGEQMLGAETYVNIDLNHRHGMFTSTSLPQTHFCLPPSPIVTSQPTHSATLVSDPLSPSLSPMSSMGLQSPHLLASSQFVSPPSSPILYFSQPDDLLFSTLSPSCNHSFDSSSTSSIAHYMNFPITTTANAVMLDHDYLTQTVVKLVKKDEVELPQPQLSNSTIDDTMLHIIVRQLSLYGSSQSFSAQSLAHYYQWSLPKQRANEWMRAVAVKQSLQQKRQLDLLPSTRQIVSWCRTNGYTPLQIKNNFCKICGHSVTLDHHEYCTIPGNLTTLTDSNLFIEQLTVAHNTNTIIDVTADILSNDCCVITEDIVYRIPQFPELRWINKTASEVGVILCPISHDKMLLHVVDHMIFAACSQFLCQLLRKAAVMTDSEGNAKERIIIPLQLYQAINSIAKFDFLTDHGLGFSI